MREALSWVGGLGEGESEGKRWVCGNEKKRKEKENKELIDICTQLLVTTSISSLLDTSSNKIRFVADNVTKHSYFQ